MIVCSCRAVAERVIRATIDDGASTVTEVGNLCAAGTRCGGCWSVLQRLLDERFLRHDDERPAVRLSLRAGTSLSPSQPARYRRRP